MAVQQDDFRHLFAGYLTFPLQVVEQGNGRDLGVAVAAYKIDRTKAAG